MTRDAISETQNQSDHALLRLRSGSIMALGVALVVCGFVAIASPAISTMAVTLFLGIVLAVGGGVKIVQALMMKGWSGFAWHLLVGLIEFGGGLLVYFNPMKGAFALTFVIALVLAAEGLAQLALAFRMRAHRGAGWMALSGMMSLLVGALLALRLPGNSAYAPGTLVGISLLFAGWAYIALAMAARRAEA